MHQLFDYEDKVSAPVLYDLIRSADHYVEVVTFFPLGNVP